MRMKKRKIKKRKKLYKGTKKRRQKMMKLKLVMIQKMKSRMNKLQIKKMIDF